MSTNKAAPSIAFVCVAMAALGSVLCAHAEDKKPSPGDVAKQKFKQLFMAVRRRNLDAIKTAAKELAAAQRQHGENPKLADNQDYQAKARACDEVIQKVLTADSVREAWLAQRRIGPSCVACHKVYNKKKH